MNFVLSFAFCVIHYSLHLQIEHAPSYSVTLTPITSAFITSTQHLQLPDVTSTATRRIYPTTPTTRRHKHCHASQGCPEQQMIPLKQSVQLWSTLYRYLSSSHLSYVCHEEFVKIKSQNPHAWGSYEIILLYVQQEIAHITVYCYGKILLKINHDYIQNQSFCV